MPNLTSGKICCTAAAIMCEVECFKQCSLYSCSESKSSTPSAKSSSFKNSSAIFSSISFGYRARCHLAALLLPYANHPAPETFMVHQEGALLEGREEREKGRKGQREKG